MVRKLLSASPAAVRFRKAVRRVFHDLAKEHLDVQIGQIIQQMDRIPSVDRIVSLLEDRNRKLATEFYLPQALQRGLRGHKSMAELSRCALQAHHKQAQRMANPSRQNVVLMRLVQVARKPETERTLEDKQVLWNWLESHSTEGSPLQNVFRRMNDDLRLELANGFSYLIRDTNQHLVYQGESNDSLVISLSGSLNAHHNERFGEGAVVRRGVEGPVIATHEPGYTFGEVALQRDQISGETLVTADISEFLVLPRDHYKHVLKLLREQERVEMSNRLRECAPFNIADPFHFERHFVAEKVFLAPDTVLLQAHRPVEHVYWLISGSYQKFTDAAGLKTLASETSITADVWDCLKSTTHARLGCTKGGGFVGALWAYLQQESQNALPPFSAKTVTECVAIKMRVADFCELLNGNRLHVIYALEKLEAPKLQFIRSQARSLINLMIRKQALSGHSTTASKLAVRKHARCVVRLPPTNYLTSPSRTASRTRNSGLLSQAPKWKGLSTVASCPSLRLDLRTLGGPRSSHASQSQPPSGRSLHKSQSLASGIRVVRPRSARLRSPHLLNKSTSHSRRNRHWPKRPVSKHVLRWRSGDSMRYAPSPNVTTKSLRKVFGRRKVDHPRRQKSLRRVSSQSQFIRVSASCALSKRY